ncbi:MAG: hypothetical protein VCB59_07605, partial [Gammaproteobacteria bacterium]
ELAPYPDEIVLSGKSEHQRYEFDHDELLISAYEAEPAKLALENYPHDEFMYLMSGKILITDDSGHLEEFLPGQVLVLKKVSPVLLRCKARCGKLSLLVVIDTIRFN